MTLFTSGKFVWYFTSLVHLNMFRVDKVNFTLELHLKHCYYRADFKELISVDQEGNVELICMCTQVQV